MVFLAVAAVFGTCTSCQGSGPNSGNAGTTRNTFLVAAIVRERNGLQGWRPDSDQIDIDRVEKAGPPLGGSQGYRGSSGCGPEASTLRFRAKYKVRRNDRAGKGDLG